MLTVDREEGAWKALAEEEIQIVLLDTAAGLNGYEICRRIRRLPQDPPLQILLIARPTRLHDLGALIEIGADDIITEPVNPQELRIRLKAACRRRQAARSRPESPGPPRRAEEEPSPASLPIGEASALVVLQQEIGRLRRKYEEIRSRNESLERTNEELLKLASVDAVTGLANRHSLFHRIEVEIDRSARLHLPLCGIMLDVDNFKRINDRFGHPCGDRVLQMIGRRLSRNLRKYDFAGRYGGEEFFILLPDTRADTGLRIAERIRTDLERTAFPCDSSSIRITLSLGVAPLQPGESCESWIGRADAALYRAKQEGRNRVLLG